MPWKLKERLQFWLAHERGTIVKDWGGRIPIALAFPNRYAVGMSNLGFQCVYGTLNSFDDVVCERVFYPEPDDLDILRSRPGRLLSLESQRPLQDFQLLLFSIPFENDFPQAVEMLALGGIPPQARQRRPSHPLVAAGGIAVFLNPEPVAPFFDFFFAGEAEVLLADFVSFWRVSGTGRNSREDVLTALATSLTGIYVPSLYEPAYLEDGTLASTLPREGRAVPERIAYRRAHLSSHPPCQTQILTPHTEFNDTLLIEIGRGCGRGCRFCAAGFVYRPVRYRCHEDITAAVDGSGPAFARVGLVSAAVSDHPQVTEICTGLLERNKVISFSSLRADSVNETVVSTLLASHHGAVAIAVEAGSERLRRVVNKNLSEEDVCRAAELLTASGVMSLKLYFMIGLPTETFEDLEAIVDLIKRVKHHVLKASRGRRRIGTITASMQAFIPKPFTPFQWVGFDGVTTLKQKTAWLRKAVQRIPNVRVHFDLPKWAYIQALLSRGDRRVAGFVEKVALQGLSWSQVIREVPHNPDFWVLRERGEKERFPWEIIDLGINRGYLWDEYQLALQERTTPPCEPRKSCKRCGACDGEQE